MRKQGFSFEFDPPAWTETGTEHRLVFRGPNGEELIISGSVIEGIGEFVEEVRSRIIENAVKAASKAASHPELRIDRPVAPAPHRAGPGAALSFWTGKALTHDASTMFAQAVVAGKRGVLLITLEAANTAQSESVYEQFFETIRPVEFVG